ncbi:Response regulator rcp1 [Dyadobacter sp. CECT 9623]|uniref:Response regulator rcp1 n=1 Tax=Dyadobacter linearis TaxID=2823330 RepID=A0ABN7R6L7_9BACT|nr:MULTISPECIES: response regulator [unclassified Dyadobacter]MCE7060063.1 response regulator [Dyadobacter sp. CY343]CAG5068828.1 Response regulator rcp1 [Dyadobacter sp. CECT 9623]
MEKKEIYLVDDSADHRLLIRTIFNEFLPNYRVRFFQGAAELYQFMVLQSAPEFSGSRPGLIILDLKMPNIDGSDLLRLIRKTPDNFVTKWSTLPIIILTSSSSDEDIQKCYAAGANSFIVKPVEFEELRFLIETICHYWMDYNTLPVPTRKENSI